MIDYLKHMAIFSTVAEKGSFSEAAQVLRIAPSRVSESVSKLEHYVDATLFHRTTRKVTLSSEGRKLYHYASAMLEDAQHGIDALRDSEASPTGSLNISVPSYLTCSPLLAAIGAFGETYRDVGIAISFATGHVDPMSDGFDVCVQAGNHEHPNLGRQKLGDVERVCVVGKDYLNKQSLPQHPKDLESWDWITYRHRKRNFRLVSDEGKRTQLTIEKQSRIQVDNFDGLNFLAKLNIGVTIMPIDVCRDDIDNGSLVRLFQDWRLSKVQHFAVWPETSGRKNLVSLFVQFVTDRLEKKAV